MNVSLGVGAGVGVSVGGIRVLVGFTVNVGDPSGIMPAARVAVGDTFLGVAVGVLISIDMGSAVSEAEPFWFFVTGVAVGERVGKGRDVGIDR